MEKILTVGGKLVSGTWKWDNPTAAQLAAYDGAYILCSHSGHDNPNLIQFYQSLKSLKKKVGFFLTLEDGSISYANQILDLLHWYKTERTFELPPAIVFPGSERTPHVVRGDFAAYFKQFIIDVDKFPAVVLGFNKSSLEQVLEPGGGDDMTSFKNLITNAKVKLWMFQFGDTMPTWIGPFKSIWMWGAAYNMNYIDYTITPTPVTPPTSTTTCKYPILVDVWEGSLEIDEALLRQAGVEGFIVRLNDMNGGHHKDENFDNQWNQVENFARAPYFVYNPWVSGKENFEWLAANCPPTGRVFVDVEVKYFMLSPQAYGKQLAEFMALAQAKWAITVYTGAWFLDAVTPWPSSEYWWARYPFALYPDSKVTITWNELIAKLNTLMWAPDSGKAPGHVKLWQCTADRYILPGCSGRPIDINIYNGSVEEMEAWMAGYTTVSVVVPPANALEILWKDYLERTE